MSNNSFKATGGRASKAAITKAKSYNAKFKAICDKFDLQGINFEVAVAGIRFCKEIQDEFAIPQDFIDDFYDLSPRERLHLERDAFDNIKKYQLLPAEKALAIDEDSNLVLNIDELAERFKAMELTK